MDRRLQLTPPEDAFREAVQFAEVLQTQGRWEEAGHAFARAGALALEHGATDPARLAWGAAGEAFRRADRVVEARDALRVALSQGVVPESERAVLQVRLSGCLTELGNGGAALQLLDAALDATEPGSAVHVLVADARFGTLLGWGDVENLESELVALEPNAWSHQLRSAQWWRLQGRLDEADAVLERLESELVGVEGAGAGLGGVRGERAELAALRGDPAESARAWASSAEEHEVAGRASLMWRSEAGRVRCLVEAGLEPFPNRVDEGLGWAADRQMVTLGLDLGLAAGIAHRDPVRLARVRDEALRLGLRRRAGRAELARCGLLDGMNRMVPLQAAAELLAGDRPYLLRVRVLHAETLAGVSLAAGVTAAQRLEPDLRAAGMLAELARVQALLEE